MAGETPVTQSPAPVETKSLFTSKTFWVNALALVAIIAQEKYGFVMDENVQFQILTVINIAIRTITHKPVSW